MGDISKDALGFIVFCVENVGQRLDMHGNNVYMMLTKDSHIIRDYILPNYVLIVK